MNSKIVTAIVLSVVAVFFATPTVAFAKSSNPSKTKALEKQLKKLGPDAPASQVQKLVKQLTALDPSKANSYVKSGLKTGALSESDAQKMATQVSKIVQSSDLPDSKKAQIDSKNQKDVDKYTPPAPTPTPYQAMITGSAVVLA